MRLIKGTTIIKDKYRPMEFCVRLFKRRLYSTTLFDIDQSFNTESKKKQ